MSVVEKPDPAAAETRTQPQLSKAPSREAAKYRRQLWDAEARVADLLSRVDAMQIRQVEQLVAADLTDPADLWQAGTTMDNLLDHDGEIDSAKVADALQAVLASRPGWRRTSVPPFDGGVGAKPLRRVTFREAPQNRRH